MHIGTAGQGVPDAAADAGGRAAKGLNLRGMVVGFVLEHQEPVLVFPIHRCGNMDGAGVDLLALVQLREHPLLFQILGADGGNIHQGLGPLSRLLFPVNRHTGGKILLIGFLHGLIVDGHLVQVGGEGGVAAVVRPIGIHHPDLGDGGIPVLLVPEVGLQELQVIQIHSKAQLVQKLRKGRFVHGNKARNRGNGFRNGIVNGQGLRLFQGGFPAFHGIDHVFLDGRHVRLTEGAGQHIHLGGAHCGTISLGDDLDALGSGIRPLVVLAGQGLHRENHIALGHFIADVVHLGFRKHRVHGIAEQLFVYVLRVIPVQQPQSGEPPNLQKVPQFPQKALGVKGLSLFLFYIYTINHVESSLFYFSACMALCPISLLR